MARKLKTFVTSVGFFDLAVAAPSMKAALDAWGFKHDAFQQGFASQTADSKIIAAATARPGLVLRRPIGTNEPFRENADLPKGFAIPAMGKPQTQPSPAPKSPRIKPGKASPQRSRDGRTSIISFEKEKAKRDRERARDQLRDEKARRKRQIAVDKAQKELDEARAKYEGDVAQLEGQRDRLEQSIQDRHKNWATLQRRLEAALRDAERDRVS